MKQVLSSPSFHNLLVACRHLPFHVTEVMLLLEHTDQRAYDVRSLGRGEDVDHLQRQIHSDRRDHGHSRNGGSSNVNSSMWNHE